MTRSAALALAIVVTVGCAAQTEKSGKADDSGKSGWLQNLPSVSLGSDKGEKAPLISDLKPGPYAASPLAIGVEKDLAQRRADGLGFVRVASLEDYLGTVRAQLAAGSGVTGVPGRVSLLANPAFAAYSTPDGNIYLAMGWLKNLENADEAAAILAHELSHILLGHHTSDMISDWYHKGQALQEIVIRAKADQSKSKTASKSDTKTVKDAQLGADLQDKVALPFFSRIQEHDADLLGVDLMMRAGYSPVAMVSMLEKLKAWEDKNKEAEDAFWTQLMQALQNDVNQAGKIAYQKGVSIVSVNHPKTEERISDVAQYVDRHYGDKKLPDLRAAIWKDAVSRNEVAGVIRNYELAFLARKDLEAKKPQDSYAEAKRAATPPTESDAYPNWILARAASALHRQQEALGALQRAMRAPDPNPQIYDDLIAYYEQAPNISTALTWTDKASSVFGGAPRWRPVKIRLLRKAGKTSEADAQTLDCSLNTPDWRRLCQDANQTPAPGEKAPATTAAPKPAPAPAQATPAARPAIPAPPAQTLPKPR